MIRQGLLVFEDSPAGASRTRLRFGGLSLLDRGIRTMARAGCERVLVVVPEGSRTRISRLPRKLDIDVEIVRWGTDPSMTCIPGEDYLLLAGDFTHHHTSLTQLVTDGLRGLDLVVQVGEDDLQSAPLHQVSRQDTVVRFLPSAAPGQSDVSTGAFLCSASISPFELATAGTDLNTFLSVRSAGRRNDTRPTALPLLWRRVVDRASGRAARDMLFSQVTKSTSGPVSRHINAKMSIPTSKLLIETGVSPHMVTVLLVLTTGLSSAFLISMPDDYLCLAMAGILWQLAAVFDRCDGEIARVKLAESKFGAWFDTVTDNIAYLSAYVGFLFAVARLYEDWYFSLAISAVAAMLLTLGIMYAYAIKTGSGSLQRYLVGFARHVPDSDKGRIYRWMERYSFVAKRDFFSFVFFVLCLSNQFELLYWFTVGGLHLLAAGVLMSQRKMLAGHRSLAQGRPVAATTLQPLSATTQGVED